MPLVRVVATSARAAEPVAQWLAQRGYQVENAYPEEPPNPFCDFEISVEQLSPAAALVRAQELAEQENCNVLVAPGALRSLQATPQPEALGQVQADYVQPPAIANPTTPRNDLQSTSLPKAKPGKPSKTLNFERSLTSIRRGGSAATNFVAAAISALCEHGRILGAHIRELGQRSGTPLKNFSMRARENFFRAGQNISDFASRVRPHLRSTMNTLEQGGRASQRQISAWSSELREEWRRRNAQRQRNRQSKIEAGRIRVAVEARAAAERFKSNLGAQQSLQPSPKPISLASFASAPSVHTNTSTNGNTNHQARATRERDWQMALAGAAIMASIIMFALGFFTRSADSASVPVTAAAPQPIPNRVGPAAAPTAVSAPSATSSVLPATAQSLSQSEPKLRPQAATDSGTNRPRQRTNVANNDGDGEDQVADEVVVRHFAPRTDAQAHPQAKTVGGVKQYSDIE